MASPDRAGAREAAVPRPSSSVVVLSATNEVLLLHRVQSSTSFALAHVFPGGNLDAFHDGHVPEPESPERHRDGPAYRLGALRECFEETGILLARRNGALVDVPPAQRLEARRRIHANELRFGDWVASLGGVPDTENLIPLTRWITPRGVPKRFTTQMYLYLLPVARTGLPSEMLVPTPDDGVEHTAALFAPPQALLRRVAEGSMVLFPPQYYLLDLVGRFLGGAGASLEEGPLESTRQRKKLLAYVRRTPTADTAEGRRHSTAAIAWGDKVICPQHLPLSRADGRVVLGLDRPGPELETSSRGGDWERVMLVRLGKGGPRDVEVRMRADVLREEREQQEQQEQQEESKL